LLVNALAYAPLAIWALAVPHTGHGGERAPRSGGGGLADIVRLLRELSANRPLVAMIGLAGCTALLVGNAFQAQMPEFAEDFGPEDPGRYAVLQTAQAAGAVAGGVLLESVGLLRPRAETAIVCGALFGVAALAFAGAPCYAVAVGVLVLVGMLRLAFSAMAQTLVQLLVPADVRGRRRLPHGPGGVAGGQWLHRRPRRRLHRHPLGPGAQRLRPHRGRRSPAPFRASLSKGPRLPIATGRPVKSGALHRLL